MGDDNLKLVDEIDGEPVFETFVLGTRGAGKTILLASLHRHLASMGSITNFYLKPADPAQGDYLRQVYSELLDPASGWPAGTFHDECFEFRCLHRQGIREFPVFRVRYHDYPGGYVSDQEPSASSYIAERAKRANSILILLDGQKVLNRLEGTERSPLHSLNHDFDLLAPVLQQCVGIPLHFAVTKSDVLNPAKHTIANVRQEILQHPGMANILRQQGEVSPSYIVPLSAVGSNFARLDTGTGLMKKRADGVIRPFGLEVIISLMLVDTMRELNRYAMSVGDVPEAIQRKLKANGRLVKGVRAGRIWSPLVGPIIGPLSLIAIYGLISAVERRLSKSVGDLEVEARDISRSIVDKQTAIRAVFEAQFLVVHRFLQNTPGAVISSARGAIDMAQGPAAEDFMKRYENIETLTDKPVDKIPPESSATRRGVAVAISLLVLIPFGLFIANAMEDDTYSETSYSESVEDPSVSTEVAELEAASDSDAAETLDFDDGNDAVDVYVRNECAQAVSLYIVTQENEGYSTHDNSTWTMEPGEDMPLQFNGDTVKAVSPDIMMWATTADQSLVWSGDVTFGDRSDLQNRELENTEDGKYRLTLSC